MDWFFILLFQIVLFWAVALVVAGARPLCEDGKMRWSRRRSFWYGAGYMFMALVVFSVLLHRAQTVMDFQNAAGVALFGFVSAPLVGFAVAYAFARKQDRTRALRRRRNQCETCAYDLTGNVSGRCPECGTVLDDVARGF